MRCPRCGEDIPDGYVYCFKCGYSIQIVPDYDVDVEKSIDESRSSIADSFDSFEVKRGKHRSADDTIEIPLIRDEIKKVRKTRCILIVLAIFIVLFVVSIMLFYRSSKSLGAILLRAHEAYDEEEYRQSVILYEQALNSVKDGELIDNDEIMVYGMALLHLEEYEKAKQVYLELFSSSPDTPEVYRGLIEAYRGLGEFNEINELLNSTENDDIYNEFKSYMTVAPKFSETSGTYSELFDVEIFADEDGDIHYTMDGSDPDEDSPIYTAPIFLSEEGEYTIKAVYINRYGMESDIVTADYSIVYDVPEPPVVEPESGGYLNPAYISASVSDDSVIYYTTDGTIPDENDRVYDQKIAMPLGSSTFTFVAYSDKGVSSNAITRSYTLGLINPSCTPEDAVNYVTASLVATGALQNIYGTVPGIEGNYQYTCTSAAKEGSRTYYLIDEFFTEPGRSPKATGTVYAVDAYSSMLYRTRRGPNGEFYFSLFY